MKAKYDPLVSRAARVAKASLAATLLILLYLAGWGVIYRIPALPPTRIDGRSSPAGDPYYLAFCSSLADGTPLGYPGHCYVVWSRKFPIVFRETESAAFVPRHAIHQIPSLFTEVPGTLVRNAWRGNLRNLDCLTVVVSEAQFEQARRIRDSWSEDNFRVGVRDCVTFSDAIARAIGIESPGSSYRYPQDYVRELKEANSGPVDHGR